MTTSADARPPPDAETDVVAAQEWSAAFGDLDLDSDRDSDSDRDGVSGTHDTSAAQSQPSCALPATARETPCEQLSVVEPLWFARTDELTATAHFAGDAKSRQREVLSFRIDRSCWLYSVRRYQSALDVLTAPQQLNAQGRAFNSKEQQLAYLDLLARCHHKLHNLSAALSIQQQVVALRPSISGLLLLAQLMADSDCLPASAAEPSQTEQRRARAAVLMRCIELCPVHASAWHELALVFLALAAACSSSSPDSSSPCCSRGSFLRCARLAFSLVADLTNFTISPHAHPAADLPTLSTALYCQLLASSQQRLAQLATELPAGDSSGGEGECARCAGVCECWRQRLHRFACLPLASLFVAEKEAQQAGVEGSKRAEKRRGKRKGGDEDESEDDTTADVDQFDALNL